MQPSSARPVIDTSSVNVDPSIIRVGKDVVELITSGMYVSPITIYREYIQNSADAIDHAIRNGQLTHQGKVAIEIDHKARSVCIRDNGSGIPNLDVADVLLAIGDSGKRGTSARGFRGVGRLSGLAYCKTLRFRTRAAGDDAVAILTWDCKKLRERLSNSDYKENLNSIIAASVTLENIPASDADPQHFFEVILEDVARHRGDILLNEAAISNYLAQVAPVAFSTDFTFGSQISEHLVTHGVSVGTVTLTVQGHAVYRPYIDRFVFPSSSFELSIDRIEFYDFANVDGESSAIGWVAHHQYARSIPPTLGIGRLRARVGDVQIGESGLFDTVFKEPRFNGWCIGEIHLLDARIKPNARRDNFELNHHAYNLFAQIGPKVIDLSNRCRTSSVSRNILLTASKLVADIDARLETSLPLGRSELSTLKASVARVARRLSSIEDEVERQRSESELQRVGKSLELVPLNQDAPVVDANEIGLLVRRMVTDRNLAKRLLEEIRKIAS